MATTTTLAKPTAPYRGRLAPSPTGYLHLGHARTFALAASRASAANGLLLYREDDLDAARCRREYAEAALEDLRWLGLCWEEPVVRQSTRLPLYYSVMEQLCAAGLVYPCHCSRKEILAMVGAPHAGEDEPVYPGTCRPAKARALAFEPAVNWRFRVPEGEEVSFTDALVGLQRAVAGVDFGDVLVWRKDGVPSYQLACAVDDAEMRITEVVRGADLIGSTFRQVLLLRAMGHIPPTYAHAPLVRDASGARLAKRHDALALRTLRAAGWSPHKVLEGRASEELGIVT